MKAVVTGVILGLALSALMAFGAICSKAHGAGESDYVSTWTVTVTENGVERKIHPTDPSDVAQRIVVDETLAPGWFCVVKPEVDFDGQRTRFLTCDYKGKTQAAIRTTCHLKPRNQAQEVWLGESFKLSVRLECDLGLSP